MKKIVKRVNTILKREIFKFTEYCNKYFIKDILPAVK